MRKVHWTAAILAAAALTLPARGQEPKVGDYYEDKTDLGFKIRVPAKWEAIPPSPDDGNLIIKYDPKTNKTIQIGKGEEMPLAVWVLKFDRRKVAKAEGKGSGLETIVSSAKNLDEWLKERGWESFKPIGGKEFQADKVAATESIYASTALSRAHEEVRLFAAIYKLEPEVDVAFVGWGPGDARRWAKFETAFREMARSFRNLDVKERAASLGADASLRDQKRAELLDQVSRTPGWKLYETPNYFIVSDNPDKAFMDELMARIEAIRAVYEQDYPAAKAKELRAAIPLTTTGQATAAKPDDPKAKGDDEDDDEDDEKKEEDKDKPKPPKPPEPDFELSQELSRCSVVRVCRNEGEYHAYGGPPQAAGHWDSNARELVIYDDRAGGGKGDTWITLNHEAFHQYIYYFYGNLAPHSWYNEGTGDFYSGYMLKNNRYTLEKNLWRRDTIKQAIRTEQFVPLKDFMRWSQKEYYGRNKLQTHPAVCYAQGWSLIYFLRTGKKNRAKGWDTKWDTLLEDYLKALVTTRKRSDAIEQCLKDIDVDALQAAWIEYTK